MGPETQAFWRDTKSETWNPSYGWNPGPETQDPKGGTQDPELMGGTWDPEGGSWDPGCLITWDPRPEAYVTERGIWDT